MDRFHARARPFPFLARSLPRQSASYRELPRAGPAFSRSPFPRAFGHIPRSALHPGTHRGAAPGKRQTPPFHGRGKDLRASPYLCPGQGHHRAGLLFRQAHHAFEHEPVAVHSVSPLGHFVVDVPQALLRFFKIGQDVHIEGMNITDAINEGVRQGYVEGYLRKSVVKDPIERENTRDNTPAVIHYEMVEGDHIEITVAPKGFGSENMSRIFMLKPADGLEGVKNSVLQAVKDAGPNACPPMVIGVGIGGTFEKCAFLAKKALSRNTDEKSPIPYAAKLEEELLKEINELGIGPGGLGGSTTALAVNVETYPTHIAGLPLAVNICCHVNRHVTRVL